MMNGGSLSRKRWKKGPQILLRGVPPIRSTSATLRSSSAAKHETNDMPIFYFSLCPLCSLWLFSFFFERGLVIMSGFLIAKNILDKTIKDVHNYCV